MTFDDFRKGTTPQETVIAVKKPILDLGNKSISEHFVNLLLFQAQLRIMHWGTESYAQHIAYGETYESINDGLDSLVESYQGYHGRLDFGCNCEFISFKNVENDSWLGSMLECLNTLREVLKESDLQNLADELIASVSKLKYLLTLK